MFGHENLYQYLRFQSHLRILRMGLQDIGVKSFTINLEGFSHLKREFFVGRKLGQLVGHGICPVPYENM